LSFSYFSYTFFRIHFFRIAVFRIAVSVHVFRITFFSYSRLFRSVLLKPMAAELL